MELAHKVAMSALEITLFSPNLLASFGSPCCMVQYVEYNLVQNTHNIHYKAIYYQVPPQLLLPSAKNVTGFN